MTSKLNEQRAYLIANLLNWRHCTSQGLIQAELNACLFDIAQGCSYIECWIDKKEETRISLYKEDFLALGKYIAGEDCMFSTGLCQEMTAGYGKLNDWGIGNFQFTVH